MNVIPTGCACGDEQGLAHVTCMTKRAVSQRGEDAWCLCRICGQRFTGEMRVALARAWVERTTARLPTDERIGALSNLCTALVAVANFGDALTVLEQLRTLGHDDPRLIRIMCTIGLSLVDNGMYAQAHALFRQFLDGLPCDALSPAGDARMCVSNRTGHADVAKIRTDVLDVVKRARGAEHPDAQALADYLERRIDLQEPVAQSPLESPSHCWICLEDAPLPPHMGCACRGSAGFAHIACLIGYATVEFGKSIKSRAWDECNMCKQKFTGSVELAMAREWFRQSKLHRDQARGAVQQRLADRIHLDAGDSLANALFNGKKHQDEALALFRKLHTESTRVHGVSHPRTLGIAGNLGAALSGIGVFQQAEQVLRLASAEAAARQVEYPNGEAGFPASELRKLMRSIDGNLAATLMNNGKNDEAGRILQRLVEMHRSDVGPNDLSTLTCECNLAAHISRTPHRLREASEMIIDTLGRSLRQAGAEHPFTKHVSTSLSQLLVSSKVEVHSIQGKSELNGQVGIAMSFDTATRQFDVKLPKGTVSVPFTNVRSVEYTPQRARPLALARGRTAEREARLHDVEDDGPPRVLHPHQPLGDADERVRVVEFPCSLSVTSTLPQDYRQLARTTHKTDTSTGLSRNEIVVVHPNEGSELTRLLDEALVAGRLTFVVSSPGDVTVPLHYKKDKTDQKRAISSANDILDMIFQCSRRSLMRWVKQYTTNDGTITGYTRKPVATKVRKDHVAFLKREIKQMKTITMADLLVKLKETYPDADITRRHLTRVVRDNNITLKMARVTGEGEGEGQTHETLKNRIKDVISTIPSEKYVNIFNGA